MVVDHERLLELDLGVRRILLGRHGLMSVSDLVLLCTREPVGQAVLGWLGRLATVVRMLRCIYLLTIVLLFLVHLSSFLLFDTALGAICGLVRAIGEIGAGLILLLAPFGRGVGVAACGGTLGGIAAILVEPVLVHDDLCRQARERSLLVRYEILFSTIALYIEIRLEGRDA